MTTIAKFATRAAVWNELRYPQAFDAELFYSLIREELNEYHDAEDLVEQVDALCDICFIAAGALWKLDLKFDSKTLDSFFNFYLLADIDYSESIVNIVHVMRNIPGLYTTACAMHQILAASFDMLSYKLGSIEAAAQALHIIADSNETKSAKVISIHAKYSEEGKGSDYVPPTAALTQLIAGIANEAKH